MCFFSMLDLWKCGMCPSFLPGSRHCLYLYFFCCVGFADSACPMTFGRVATVQPKAVTLVNPLASFVRQDVVPNAVNIKKHRLTPLERELEAVEGISLDGASRARFHPQLWQCFVDRSWPDKELVVVETYHGFIMVSLYNLRPFFKALRWWTLVWNTLGSNVQSVRTSQWVPSQKIYHFVGLWAVLREFRRWWSLCRQVCRAQCALHTCRHRTWWLPCSSETWWPWPSQVGTTSSKLEAPRDTQNPTHGIQRIKMKWTKFCTAMVLPMCTWGWWLYFSHIPI